MQSQVGKDVFNEGSRGGGRCCGGWALSPATSRVHGPVEILQAVLLLLLPSLEDRGNTGRAQPEGPQGGMGSDHRAGSHFVPLASTLLRLLPLSDHWGKVAKARESRGLAKPAEVKNEHSGGQAKGP